MINSRVAEKHILIVEKIGVESKQRVMKHLICSSKQRFHIEQCSAIGCNCTKAEMESFTLSDDSSDENIIISCRINAVYHFISQ